MKTKLTIIIFVFLCASTAAQRFDPGKIFSRHGVYGAFILYDLNNDKFLTFNDARLDSSFLPASTFKIFNSLAGLETGAVQDENEIIQWEGKDWGWDQWNKDHTMESAIENSVVWYYQEVARRIGSQKMQEYINKAGYGNKNITGGIDKFWLNGGLRITPRQQIAFLVDFYQGDLPFSPQVIEKVKGILVVEEGNNFTLRGKTGWTGDNNPGTGWFVGYLETGSDIYFFANNLDIYSRDQLKARTEIPKEIFKELNLIE